MSRPVRVRTDVAARVDGLAAAERRSFANMVEVLLLAALSERGVRAGVATPRGHEREDEAQAEGPAQVQVAPGAPRSVSADDSATVSQVGRAHMKKTRPAVECPSRVFVDGVCVECGAEA